MIVITQVQQVDQQDDWRKDIAVYERPNIKYSLWQILNTVIPFIFLWYLAYLSLTVSYILTLPLVVLASGFLVRIFIIFHDCCHKSFFKSRIANEVVGTVFGILTFCPYHQWKYSHTTHHATVGNLNKRGIGDIWTLTAKEYLAMPWYRRLLYRLYRSPLIMFGFGPVYIFLIDYRFNRRKAKLKERMNTYITNLAIVAIIVLLCLAIGWKAFLLVHVPIFYLSGVLGIWLFYVQHQFEDTYYESEQNWNYEEAAFEGSSFYKLPKILHWITGNIGFHHIHHLSSRIPNYYLERVHDKNPYPQRVRTITLPTSLRSLKFRIWNEEHKRLVRFKDIKQVVNEKSEGIEKLQKNKLKGSSI